MSCFVYLYNGLFFYLLFQPKRILGRDFVLGPLFFSPPFLAILRLMIFGTCDTSLESSCKTLSFGSWENFSVLFVWKLRGFKVLKNEQMTSEMSGPVDISDLLISDICTYIYAIIPTFLSSISINHIFSH